MEPTFIGPILLFVGLLCMLAEVKIPGFFIAIPGSVLTLLGLLGVFWPALLFSALSPLVALAGIAAATTMSIHFYRRLAPPDRPPITSHPQGLVGEHGILAKCTSPTGLGRVRLRGQLWSCRSSEPLAEGSSVLVIDSCGGHLVVVDQAEVLSPRKERASLDGKAREALPGLNPTRFGGVAASRVGQSMEGEEKATGVRRRPHDGSGRQPEEEKGV